MARYGILFAAMVAAAAFLVATTAPTLRKRSAEASELSPLQKVYIGLDILQKVSVSNKR